MKNHVRGTEWNKKQDIPKIAPPVGIIGVQIGKEDVGVVHGAESAFFGGKIVQKVSTNSLLIWPQVLDAGLVGRRGKAQVLVVGADDLGVGHRY